MGEREPRKPPAWPEWHKAVRFARGHGAAMAAVVQGFDGGERYCVFNWVLVAWVSQGVFARRVLARTADPRLWDV